MAKVIELAKELNKPSKEIIDFLQKKGIEGKTPQSPLEDDVAGMVRKELGNDKPQGAPARADGEAPRKKRNIIIVSNQPNSKIPGQRSQGSSRPVGKGNYSTQTGGYSQPAASRPEKGSNRSGQGGARQKPQSQSQSSFVRPIKPLTPPSPTPSVQMVATKPAAKPRPAGKPKEALAEPVKDAAAVPAQELAAAGQAKVQEQAAASRPVQEDVTIEKEQAAAPAAKAAEPESRPVERTRAQEGRGEARRSQEGRGEARAQEGRSQEGREGRREGRTQEGRGEGRFQEGRGEARRSQEGRSQEGREGRREGRPSEDRPADARNRDGRSRDRGAQDRAGGQAQGRGGASNGRPSYNRQDGMARPARAGADGGSDSRRGGGSGQGAGRGGANYGRDARGAAGQGSRFHGKDSSGGFAQEAPSKDMEKKREQDKRRISQEKDKRSRREMIYEEEESLKKPGRFIKPEKKEEAAEEAIKVITLPESITIKDLADKMRMQPAAIIKKLFLQGKIVTVNQEISYEDAEGIAMDYEILCEKEEKVDVIEELLREDEEEEASMVERPPVVCVMGHVDHGKTSLLDAIRKTNVTDKEAGGITQHIGAYTVNVNNRRITFLDTPGHEAFTAMRMRGANATDIAILVVAADDGVMPQTIEAINHAKAAGVEIIVAINKIDKPSANVERVKQELTEYGLVAEEWGGSTVFAPVSAKTGEGIEEMLEMILLTADILELRANPKRRARGLVIEAQLDKGRGPVATVLVQKGTLRVGDFISAGASHGKVRAMIDDKGKRLKEATPSTPVEILGLNDVPSAGEVFLAHDNDKTAKTYAETYLAQHKEKMIEETKARMSLDDLFSQIKEGNLKELNLIVKADVQGSVEAVKQSLSKLSNEEVVVKCIHGGVGAINESDVMLAGASNAIIIGFNVRPDATAKATAEREGVDVRLYKVIYQAIEDIEAAMKGMLDPIFEEKVIGHAEVRQIFRASAIGNIAGAYVLDGVFQRNCKIRITRQGEQIYEGELASLKRFKDDVKEVKAGFECGLVFKGYDQMQELDIVEAYIMVEVPR